jgi:uncharacterized protein (DUF1330 family)
VPVYVIGQNKIIDNSWVPEYRAKIHGIVERHGGRFLTRSANIKTIEGDPPDVSLIAILEFPTAEAAEAMLSDPEHIALSKARRAGSKGSMVLIDDTDVGGSIPYLRKG